MDQAGSGDNNKLNGSPQLAPVQLRSAPGLQGVHSVDGVYKVAETCDAVGGVYKGALPRGYTGQTATCVTLQEKRAAAQALAEGGWARGKGEEGAFG